jgi:hypothetical protein
MLLDVLRPSAGRQVLDRRRHSPPFRRRPRGAQVRSPFLVIVPVNPLKYGRHGYHRTLLERVPDVLDDILELVGRDVRREPVPIPSAPLTSTMRHDRRVRNPGLDLADDLPLCTCSTGSSRGSEVRGTSAGLPIA